MSIDTWSNRASAIWEATVRCQISRYSANWPLSNAPATRSGVRMAEVGRMASWASWAPRCLVLYRRGCFSAYAAPNSVLTTSAISRSADSAMVVESVRM